MTHYQDLYLARVPGKAYGQLIGFLSDHIYNFQLLVLHHPPTQVLIFRKQIPCWSSGMTAFSESTVPEWSSWDSALLTDSTGLSDMGATELLEDNRNRRLSTWLGLM